MESIDLQSKIMFNLAWHTRLMSDKLANLFYYRQLQKVSIHCAQYIPTHMSAGELNTLYKLTKSLKPLAKVLEIGSYLGASTCYIAAALAVQNGHLFCVDTWENQTMPEGEMDTYSEFQRNTSGVAKYITPIRKNSKDLVASDIVYPLNFVFIDGDHSYAAVKNDYEKTAPWIAEDGILAFHDCIYFEGVSKTIGEALASGTWKIGGHIDNLLWLNKGRMRCY